MKEKYYLFPLLLSLAILFFSCSEKEVELPASADVLFQVRANKFEIKVKDGTNNGNKIIDAATLKLKDKAHFVRGHVYEMKQGDAQAIEFYTSLDNFHDRKIEAQGKYLFDPNAMYVTFDFEGAPRTYSIDGYFGEIFYKHFVYKDGVGTPHIIEARKVFCLHEDFTEELKVEFPDLVSACIKTDMITARRLETTK